MLVKKMVKKAEDLKNKCLNCGEEYIKNGNAQKYCLSCRDKAIKKEMTIWKIKNKKRILFGNALRNRKYRKLNWEKVKLKQKTYRKIHRDKFRCWCKLYHAIKNGKIIKQKKCSICNSTNHINAHHFDYSKPYKVVWVCRLCHKSIHKDEEISRLKQEIEKLKRGE